MVGPRSFLDAAVAQLGEVDRNAIVLRYYQQESLDEVGRELGLNADAAQKRVTRALEKPWANFARQGVTHSADAIAGTVSQNAVMIAPAGLATKISVVAAKGAATTTMATLVNGEMAEVSIIGKNGNGNPGSSAHVLGVGEKKGKLYFIGNAQVQ